MKEVKLERVQQKFFDAVMYIVHSDTELFDFAIKKATGKTFTLNYLDKCFTKMGNNKQNQLKQQNNGFKN